MEKLDKRRKYYLILDCETATLPYAVNYSESEKKKIAIAKPLIYDIGWTVIDRRGKIYRKENFLISEIFSVPSIFNTAYYAEKRPVYLEKLENGEITLTDWRTATKILERDLLEVSAVGAYNSMFDFKKAIPFTELYINMLYSKDYYNWLSRQEKICDNIASGVLRQSDRIFESEIFRFRKNEYPLFDVWGLACKNLLNNDGFRSFCIKNDFLTASKKYFSTTAENAFRFCFNKADFIESHTALDDAEIESKLFSLIVKKNLSNFEIGIIYFPFREVGKVENFI